MVALPRYGLQFTTHLANDHSVQELVSLARVAQTRGMHQVWVNDNAGYRSQTVILSAMAASVPIHVGTAIMVPYFHHPVDQAGALITVAELAEDREVCVGMARGDIGQAAQHVRQTKPVSMVEQYARFLRLAVTGNAVPYGDFPVLCEYFNLNPDGRFQSRIAATAPVTFFGGGVGPLALAATGRAMDGLLSSGTFLPLARVGRLSAMHATAQAAAVATDPGKRLRKVCELNVSVSGDRAAAVKFPKRQTSHSVLQWEKLGFTDEEYAKLGVRRSEVHALQEHYRAGGSVEDAAALVTDDMLRACYLAGTPEDVAEDLRTYSALAVELGYEQIIFAKLGPNYREAIDLLTKELMPNL